MADSEDGSPYATRSNEPDMQGAGVVNPPTSTMGSLIDALSSMGTGGGAIPPPPPGMPPGPGMGGLMGMLPPPPSNASVFAQALSGGISAMRGQPDPVQAMVHQQQQQQNVIAQMMMKMSEQERLATQWRAQNELAQKRFLLDEKTKKDEMQLRTRAENRLSDQPILQGLKDNPNPIAREAYAKRMSDLAGQNGSPLPPAAFLTQLQVPEKEQDSIRGAIEAGLPDEQILTLYPHAQTPGYLEAERTIMKSPVMRAKLGYKTDEELRGIQYDLVTKKAAAGAIEHGFKLDSPEYRFANDAFRQATGGRNIYDADPKSVPDMMAITQARQQGQAQALAQEEQKKRMEAAVQRETLDYTNKLSEARQEARDVRTEDRQISREQRKVLPGTWIDMQTGTLVTPTQGEYDLNGGSKRYRNSNPTEENLLARLATVTPMTKQIGTLIDGLLKDNTPDNLVNAMRGNISNKLRNNAAWAQLNTLITDQNVELTGALGPGQFRTQLLTVLQNASITTRDTREVAHIVQDTIDTSIQNRRQAIVSGGNDAAMRAYKNPLVPKTPAAGAVLKDGNWYSQSGKFIWRDGQWTPVP